MEGIFLTLLNRSITASWLILAVMVFRVLFRNSAKSFRPALWALVGVRLLWPYAPESSLSLIPSSQTVSAELLQGEAPAIHTGIEAANALINPVLAESVSPPAAGSVSPMENAIFIAAVIWIAGMAAMAVYTAVNCLEINRVVRESVPLDGCHEENIWICDRISSPFISGIFRPRIYLPSRMAAGMAAGMADDIAADMAAGAALDLTAAVAADAGDNGASAAAPGELAPGELDLVIAHEKVHLRRWDHRWKPLGFLLLTVYWFNPLLWVTYVLFCRDIELACDEAVIRQMGENLNIKKNYANALIRSSIWSGPRKTLRKGITACPLAFGETGVKGRIRAVLKYRKPARWLTAAAVMVCIIIAACFLTDPSVISPEEQALRQKYPQYFDLDTKHGLDVYVWELGPGPYSCGLLPGSETGHASEEVLSLQVKAPGPEPSGPASIEDMKAILKCYDLPEEKITIIRTVCYLSSYFDPIDEQEPAKLRELFGLENAQVEY